MNKIFQFLLVAYLAVCSLDCSKHELQLASTQENVQISAADNSAEGAGITQLPASAIKMDLDNYDATMRQFAGDDLDISDSYRRSFVIHNDAFKASQKLNLPGYLLVN